MKEQASKMAAQNSGNNLTDIFAEYRDQNGAQKGALIPILQKVQGREGFLSEDSVNKIADFLKVSANEVYGVATFYAQFRFTQPGEHTVKVCLGTACHVRGGARLLEKLERDLRVKPGETTEDLIFSLESVSCLGACALGPLVVVDGKYLGQMNSEKLDKVLKPLMKA